MEFSVESCSFRGAKLAGSALGTWYEQKGNRFSSVDFTGADLREVGFRGATFIDCDFGEARLDKVEFRACEFVRCRFAGYSRSPVPWGSFRRDRRTRVWQVRGRRFPEGDVPLGRV